LAALLHGTLAAEISQTAAWYNEWKYGTFTEGATYIWLDGHHVGHRPTFLFSVWAAADEPRHSMFLGDRL